MTELNEGTVQKLDFFARPADEQQDFLQQTWCNTCMEMDLGMKNPVEYRDKDKLWIEGECVKCSTKVVTEIVEEDE
ncbi:hypothetical protein [Marinomonas pollencensis]|uniref:Uncharacterized protein n=1 Tax=Marinomonas pollencensis TaxID=491954 RepID=A0A3E0DPP0_9GAMM|nr:hypothetical protein DFP81_10434 [Marinomonas pollencensis]